MTISSDEMDRAFHGALAELAADTEELTARHCETWGPAADLAELCFAGDRGGWHVHAALRSDAGLRPEQWATRVSALWVPEHGERRYALDVTLSGHGARDGRLLAALVVFAVLADREDHSGSAGRLPEKTCPVCGHPDEAHNVEACSRCPRGACQAPRRGREQR